MNSKSQSTRIFSILLLALVCSNSFAQSEVSEQNGQLSQRVLNLESSIDSALNRIEALEQMAGYYPELSIFDANDLKVGKKVLGLARQLPERGIPRESWELQATVLFDDLRAGPEH